MRAEELRLNNFVMYAGRIGKVAQLDNEEGVCFIGIDSDHLNGLYKTYIEPIPLTEEWLLKFGFVKRAMFYNIELNDYTLLQLSICNDKGKGEYYAMIMQEDEMTSIPKRILYVHEAQNLFHILTGKELECQNT